MLELAPKCPACRLVCTGEEDGEITITLLDYTYGFRYFNLNETDNQRQEIRDYISSLLPNILKGSYKVELLDVAEDTYFNYA